MVKRNKANYAIKPAGQLHVRKQRYTAGVCT